MKEPPSAHRDLSVPAGGAERAAGLGARRACGSGSSGQGRAAGRGCTCAVERPGAIKHVAQGLADEDPSLVLLHPPVSQECSAPTHHAMSTGAGGWAAAAACVCTAPPARQPRHPHRIAHQHDAWSRDEERRRQQVGASGQLDHARGCVCSSHGVLQQGQGAGRGTGAALARAAAAAAWGDAQPGAARAWRRSGAARAHLQGFGVVCFAVALCSKVINYIVQRGRSRHRQRHVAVCISRPCARGRGQQRAAWARVHACCRLQRRAEERAAEGGRRWPAVGQAPAAAALPAPIARLCSRHSSSQTWGGHRAGKWCCCRMPSPPHERAAAPVPQSRARDRRWEQGRGPLRPPRRLRRGQQIRAGDQGGARGGPCLSPAGSCCQPNSARPGPAVLAARPAAHLLPAAVLRALRLLRA